MQIRWEEDAIDDLQSLYSYIKKDNPAAAEKVANKILSSVDLLFDHPLLGKAGRIHKTRELVVKGTPYTVVYLAEFEAVTLLRIFHQQQSWTTLRY